MGWKETVVNEHAGEPVQTISRIIISPSDPEKLKANRNLSLDKPAQRDRGGG